MARASKRWVNIDRVCLGDRHGREVDLDTQCGDGLESVQERKGGKAKKSRGGYFISEGDAFTPLLGRSQEMPHWLQFTSKELSFASLQWQSQMTEPKPWGGRGSERNHSCRARSSMWCQAGGLKCKSEAGSCGWDHFEEKETRDIHVEWPYLNTLWDALFKLG